MRFKDKTFNFVVNFLLGVAWATVFLGFITSFLSTYHSSIPLAIVYGAIAMLPGMIGVLLLEHTITHRQTYEELQKQTKLLERLLADDSVV